MIHGGNAGIIDEGIDRSELALDCANHYKHGIFVGNIKREVAVIFRLDVCFASAASSDAPSLIEEMFCKCVANAPPGASNECNRAHFLSISANSSMM